MDFGKQIKRLLFTLSFGAAHLDLQFFRNQALQLPKTRHSLYYVVGYEGTRPGSHLADNEFKVKSAQHKAVVQTVATCRELDLPTLKASNNAKQLVEHPIEVRGAHSHQAKAQFLPNVFGSLLKLPQLLHGCTV